MKPEKALELVCKYARLTKAIAAKKKEIGGHLNCCRGFSGKHGDPFEPLGEIDAKGREKDLHLNYWYTAQQEPADSGYGYQYTYPDFASGECPHCYAAHLAIQERKELVRELGHVKRSITRSIA